MWSLRPPGSPTLQYTSSRSTHLEHWSQTAWAVRGSSVVSAGVLGGQVLVVFSLVLEVVQDAVARAVHIILGSQVL